MGKWNVSNVKQCSQINATRQTQKYALQVQCLSSSEIMGRSPGSPNISEYHWHFIMSSPTDHNVIVWKSTQLCSKCTKMHNDLQLTSTYSQLRSYASQARRCPKNITIKRIFIPVEKT